MKIIFKSILVHEIVENRNRLFEHKSRKIQNRERKTEFRLKNKTKQILSDLDLRKGKEELRIEQK